MRPVTIIAAILLCVTCATLPLQAQWLPRNFSADSSFRVEYLLGTQTLGQHKNTSLILGSPNPIERLRIDFSNSQAVLDGVVEITPRPTLSARVRGSASVFNADRSFTFETGPRYAPIPNTAPQAYGWAGLPVTIKPQFWLWEAAGLYNLSYEDVYRYSIVAGYRQESWKYPTSNSQANSPYLSDVFGSQIPFLGLQTVMFCPLWKARFEVLGSAFMSKNVTHTARDQPYYMQLDGTLTNGGFLEFQVEGNINVTPRAWMGIYSQYTYEGLKGELTGTSQNGDNSGLVPSSYNFYTLKNIWIIGLNCNFVF
ncbi:MAG: hypothetical protein ACLQO6_13945 [Desulfomonilaceae bacterium]